MRFLHQVLLCFGLLSLSARAATPAAVTLKPVQVSAHAWYVQGRPGVASADNQGFNSNAGFVVTPDGVVVVDALGTPALGRELLRAIRTVTNQPIRRVSASPWKRSRIAPGRLSTMRRPSRFR